MTRDTQGYERVKAALLDAFACVIEGRSATYVSTPVTTGRRFVDWYSRHGRVLESDSPEFERCHREAVVVPNAQRAAEIVQALRRSSPRIIIDPSPLVIPGWSQDDYRALWATVIERYVDTVVCVDGWQYSNGCVYEHLVAIRSGATVRCENGSPLKRREGIRLIRRAVAKMRRLAVPTQILENVLASLVVGDADDA